MKNTIKLLHILGCCFLVLFMHGYNMSVVAQEDESMNNQETIPVQIDDMEGMEIPTNIIDELPITQEDIKVQDIVVSEFKNEMKIDEQQSINATIIPMDATNQNITYRSLNSKVASVDALGNVTAINKGSTVIVVSADGVEKELSVKVKVATQMIKVNKTYITMISGEAFQLTTEVKPSEADQNLKYRSTSSDIVSVTDTGNITANKAGEATIIISNSDMQEVVTIIVRGKDDSIDSNNTENLNNQSKNNQKRDNLAEKIKNSEEDTIIVDGDDIEKVSSEVLKQIYGTEKKIIIEYDDYSIILYGKDIKNVQNEFNTEIQFEEIDGRLSLIFNEKRNIPGKIQIKADYFQKYKYSYLYNGSKDEHELVDIFVSSDLIEINHFGKYIFSESKIDKFTFNMIIIISTASIIIILAGVYIFVKKKHWFW